MKRKDLIKKIADQLIQHEGLKLMPYHCPAVGTRTNNSNRYAVLSKDKQGKRYE
jgi:hypothetical protein